MKSESTFALESMESWIKDFVTGKVGHEFGIRGLTRNVGEISMTKDLTCIRLRSDVKFCFTSVVKAYQ